MTKSLQKVSNLKPSHSPYSMLTSRTRGDATALVAPNAKRYCIQRPLVAGGMACGFVNHVATAVWPSPFRFRKLIAASGDADLCLEPGFWRHIGLPGNRRRPRPGRQLERDSIRRTPLARDRADCRLEWLVMPCGPVVGSFVMRSWSKPSGPFHHTADQPRVVAFHFVIRDGQIDPTVLVEIGRHRAGRGMREQSRADRATRSRGPFDSNR